MPDTSLIASKIPSNDVRLLPDALKSFDRRTRQYKRAKGLADAFAELQGGWAGLAALERERIGLAAVAIVASERTMADYVNGDHLVTATDCTRAINVANRAIKAVGHTQSIIGGPSLDEYLAAKAGAR